MILYNERFTERDDAIVDIEDRGYQFGDGVYEVIRVYDGVCFEMDVHVQRLKLSALKIELALPYPLEEITRNLIQLVEKNGLLNGYIYVQITRGISQRAHHFPGNTSSVLVAYTQNGERPVETNTNGIHAILTEDIRWKRCDIKSLNLLPNVLAKQQAKKNGCDEAIMHRGSTVSEGSSSNVYIVERNVIYTHPINNLILNGITRIGVLQMARENGFRVVEKAFTVNELLEADEVFVTSTAIEICPVIQIDQTQIGTGQPGRVTRALQQAFEHRIAFNSCNN
ncbi:MAG TPA: D-amino-acid transaminase [Paenisporosarcina sp.]|nr:D-amino-acid transaminase [Paenisporosarcina sp.]